ncbi:MAG: PQQ-dependent sugar dehydrogenase [Limnobacter sp.]|nr:PQQ-dependent sugar dehydrogenase [Limnobacter sp.]
MSKFKTGSQIFYSFFSTVVFGVILGSLIQTQLNLSALGQLGVPISLNERLQTSLHDLTNFAPVYFILFGLSFLISQSVAVRVAAKLQNGSDSSRKLWCSLGAAVGLWATFKLVDSLVPMPTLIAATRDFTGQLLMLVPAALSGYLFASLSRSARLANNYAPQYKRSFVLVAGVAGLGLLLTHADGVQAQQSEAYKIETVAEGLRNPWSIAFLPDGRALVTEREGRLRLIQSDGKLQAATLAGVPAVYSSGQAGLFDVLVASNFAQTQEIFLSYACGTRSANFTCIARGKLSAQGLQDVKEIFRSQVEKSGNAHYGGRMVLLPDNTLVLTLGDGFDYREQAQNLSNHFGKLVRINTDGTVPKDNPFTSRKDHKPEIYSYGHRNPQGLAYDAKNNRLIEHEHGPRGGDEINIIKPGSNYGWPLATYGIDYNGAKISPYTEREGTVQPAMYWTPSIAASGITVYDGDLFPKWKGNLLVGALAAKQVKRVVLDGNKATEVESLFKELNERIRDVRTGPGGAIYLLTDSSNGRVLKVSPVSAK